MKRKVRGKDRSIKRQMREREDKWRDRWEIKRDRACEVREKE